MYKLFLYNILKDEENLRRDRLLGNLIDETRTLTQTRIKFPGLYIMLISGCRNDRSVRQSKPTTR